MGATYAPPGVLIVYAAALQLGLDPDTFRVPFLALEGAAVAVYVTGVRRLLRPGRRRRGGG